MVRLTLLLSGAPAGGFVKEDFIDGPAADDGALTALTAWIAENPQHADAFVLDYVSMPKTARDVWIANGAVVVNTRVKPRKPPIGRVVANLGQIPWPEGVTNRDNRRLFRLVVVPVDDAAWAHRRVDDLDQWTIVMKQEQGIHDQWVALALHEYLGVPLAYIPDFGNLSDGILSADLNANIIV